MRQNDVSPSASASASRRMAVGSRIDRIKEWLDENCGASGWVITPSGTGGGLNDALSIYFGDAALASAFVAMLCRTQSRNRGAGRAV